MPTKTKERVPIGLLLIILAGVILAIFVPLDVKHFFGKFNFLIVSIIFSLFIMGIVYIIAGWKPAIFSAASLLIYMQALAIPKPYNVYFVLGVIAIFYIWMSLKTYNKKKRLKQKLLKDNAKLNKATTQEMVEIAANISVTPTERTAYIATEVLREAGQLRLTMGSSFINRMYAVYHIEGTFYFVKMNIAERAKLPPAIRYPEREKAEAWLRDRKHSYKIEADDIISVRVEPMKCHLELFIKTSNCTYGLRTDGSIHDISSLQAFFGKAIPVEVVQNAANTINEIEDKLEYSKKELARRRAARVWIKTLTPMSIVSAAWLLFFLDKNTSIIQVVLCMLASLTGILLYIIFCPLISLDVNKRGAPSIVMATIPPATALMLVYIRVAKESGVAGLGDWGLRFGVLWVIITMALFAMTREYKISKGILISLPFIAGYISMGAAAGWLLLMLF